MSTSTVLTHRFIKGKYVDHQIIPFEVGLSSQYVNQCSIFFCADDMVSFKLFSSIP